MCASFGGTGGGSYPPEVSDSSGPVGVLWKLQLTMEERWIYTRNDNPVR